MTEFLTAYEAAEFLRISRSTLDRLAAAGEIVFSKLGDSQTSKVLYKRADLEAYVDSHKVKITQQVRVLRAG